MARILVLHSSIDGHTKRIAQRIGAVLASEGHIATLRSADAPAAGAEIERCDAVIVGAAIRYGHYAACLEPLVSEHRAAIEARPNAFFSVCLAIVSRFPEDRAEARRIANAWPIRLGWKPAAVEVIAGALMFSRYGFLRRWALTRIARKELGDVDTTRDHVYTDWEAVERFVLDLTGERRRPDAAGFQEPGTSFRI